MLDIVLLLLIALPLVFFFLYHERRERYPKIDKKSIGSGKTYISRITNCVVLYNGGIGEVTTADKDCAICGQRILKEVDRVVSYEKGSMCYLCWKRHNFINISEKLLLLREILGGDIILHIKEWMFHEDWEVCDFAELFPSHYHDVIIPPYREIPTLKLPIFFKEENDGILVQWIGYTPECQRTHWIILNVKSDNIYHLAIFTFDYSKYLNLQVAVELNPQNLANTLRLVNHLQDKKLLEILDLFKGKLRDY